MSTVNDYAGNFTIDPAHSEIGFTARHAMVTKVRGSFNEFSGTATSGENLADAAISVTIAASSLDTRNADRDGHVKSEDFFDVEKFPEITFTSTSVTAAGDDALEVTGDLTIKDVTKQVTVPFEFDGEVVDPWGATRVGFSGSTTINRTDFGLTWNAPLKTDGVLVSEKITLNFDISATKDA
ncbi:MAG: YceI family protein [Corynebacterium sp.]|uniref:YceI family protein n=1 Tax=Corynebacterium TaxID=1716 RepID=UPI002647EF1A|nr:YceI family protein [Corynebacterium sp.]MDN5721963.1 YceI family protein [Corynebacterium sp.]MDN6282419.1 YceI family protein [Corynebacterium sp.]MDN6305352.1 YceI family protein [Corynebacterium sp.]MDN6352432.1 YceI family protein [Corynebacterium sp.]MDN6367616.1 YceI family protein [Corynebacterium sp.]